MGTEWRIWLKVTYLPFRMKSGGGLGPEVNASVSSYTTVTWRPSPAKYADILRISHVKLLFHWKVREGSLLCGFSTAYYYDGSSFVRGR
jgi:hypothetical protein